MRSESHTIELRRQKDLTGGSAPLFSKFNDADLVHPIGVLVHQRNGIAILFDLTGLAQIGQCWSLVRSFFAFSIKL